MPRGKPLPPREQRWPNNLSDEAFDALITRVKPDLNVLHDIIALAFVVSPDPQRITDRTSNEDARESA